MPARKRSRQIKWRQNKRLRATAKAKIQKVLNGEPKKLHSVDEPKPKSRIQRLQEALQTNASTNVYCRQSEQEDIRRFLESCIGQRQGDSLYICGSPGTGKSLCVDMVCKRVVREKDAKLQVVSFNAMSLASPVELYKQLLQQLGYQTDGINAFDAAERLKVRFFGQKTPLTICVVDEIDALLTKSQTVLYRLFEWPKQAGSRMILIGISNNIDLTDRFLPRLRSRSCEPGLLVFEPYSHTQLADILRSRIESALAPDPQDVFESKALEICARKISAKSGDMRKCMDICRQCLDALGEDLKEQKVGLRQMLTALRSSLGSEMVSRIADLPMQEKVLLMLVGFYHKIQDAKEVTVQKFQKWMTGFSKGLIGRRIPILSTIKSRGPHFIDLLTGISENGLVNISKGKRMSERRIRLTCTLHDIQFALKPEKQLCMVLEEMKEV